MALPLAAAKYPAKGNEIPATAATAAARLLAATAARITAARVADAARAAAIAALDADAANAAFAAADATTAARVTAARAAAIAAFDADAARAAAAAGDAQFIIDGGSFEDLARLPLWREGWPIDVRKLWLGLRRRLDAEEQDWDVWIRWYDAILEGRPTPGGEELDIYRVKLGSEDDWQQGPADVNALIKKKEEEIGIRSPREPNIDPTSDYFLSYSTKDENFAKWISALIERHGRSVFTQFKDMRAGNNFVHQINFGIARSRNFIALLSPDYEASDQCQSEWSAAYNLDPSGRERRIRPFRIRPVDLNSLARQVVYVDLFALGEAEATAAVLSALDISVVRDTPPPPWPKTETVERLVAIASPKAILTPLGQLDAGPNAEFDAPLAGDDLPTLPIRQRALIGTIIDGLPANAPRTVWNALEAYDHELLVRGVRPIVGLLNDMADVIEAGVTAGNAKAEWLDEAMAKAFERLQKNHQHFRDHFPLDEERELQYGNVQIDEDAAQGEELVEPFVRAAKAIDEAKDAGIPTDDFVRIVVAMKDFAEVVATQPLPPKRSSRELAEAAALDTGRPPENLRLVSRKKRLIVTAVGFFAGTAGLMASSTQLMTTNWTVLMESLQDVVERLSKFIFF